MSESVPTRRRGPGLSKKFKPAAARCHCLSRPGLAGQLVDKFKQVVRYVSESVAEPCQLHIFGVCPSHSSRQSKVAAKSKDQKNSVSVSGIELGVMSLKAKSSFSVEYRTRSHDMLNLPTWSTGSF